ncbi:hypothetical protein IW138_001524 [Coemansia sp. RSA 986]|nr:hypothetical protein IW138_001524 [Coemansia sp. RSA 986]
MKKRRSSGKKNIDYDQCKAATTTRSRTKLELLLYGLDSLPELLLSSIFHHASGLVEANNYLLYHLQQRHLHSFSLPLLATMIRRCCPAMVQTKRSWRRLLLPEFYRTALYDGKTNVLLIPDECIRHMRRILINIPENYMSFRSVARAMYHLPEDVRARISWLGLCMGNDTRISMSEYGALSGAFPNALSLSADLAYVYTSAKALDPILIDPQMPTHISTLTFRCPGLAEESLAVQLIQRTAWSLEYLDLGNACLAAICRVLWPERIPSRHSHNKHLSVFPKLKHLRFTLSDTLGANPGWHPRQCEFLQLERMRFAIEPANGRGIRGVAARLDPAARQWLAKRLLMYVLPCLTHLELDCVNEAVILEARRHLPNLKHLHLIQHSHLSFGPGSDTAEPSLSRILNSAISIESLREYRNWSSFYARYTPLKLMSSYHRLRELNIATWVIGLCDLQLLLARMPELEDIHATLSGAHVYPQLEAIAYNVTMKRMWLDSAFGEAGTWVKGPLDALISFVAHMMNLEELLLFSKAFLRLERAVSRQTNEDLIRLARTVNIGQCHRDERRIKGQTIGGIQ